MSLSQRQDVRVREAAGHGRTRIQYQTVLESRTQRPSITLTPVPSSRSRVRRKHQTSRGGQAGTGRQAGMRRPRERERKACEREPFQAARCGTMHLARRD